MWGRIRLPVRTAPKYGNNKVVINGEKFDSQLEAARWGTLRLLERAGQIELLSRQVKFILIEKSQYGRAISYVADFTYYIGDKFVVEDVKSEATKTRVYELKKRLMAEIYGIKIQEIMREDM